MQTKIWRVGTTRRVKSTELEAKSSLIPDFKPIISTLSTQKTMLFTETVVDKTTDYSEPPKPGPQGALQPQVAAVSHPDALVMAAGGSRAPGWQG